MSTAIKIADGIYFLHPEGSAWIGAEYRNGRLVGRIEESNASTHATAGDRYAGVVLSDADQDVPADVQQMIVLDVMGEDIDAEMVCVQQAAE